MKKIKLVLIFSSLFFSACIKPSEKLAVIKVWGNCTMCKKTIETSLEKEGIYEVLWNPDTKWLDVSYDSTRWDVAKIEKQVSSVGYDTQNEKGNDQAYANLHECCQYDRKK